MLDIGDTAPSVTLPGSDGEQIREYQLSDYTSSGAVVLLFYPFDFSPVCTTELCEFRDAEWLTHTSDLDVFGISADSAYTHLEFIQSNDLPFPLLSDHDASVSAEFGAIYDELEGHPRVSKRAVFLIDDADTIRYTWEAETYTDDPDISEVHEAALRLNSLDVMN